MPMVISSRDRWLIAGVGAFAVTLVAWRWGYAPLGDRLKAAHEALTQAQNELHRNQTDLKREGDQTKRKEHVDELQQQLATLVPGRESARYFVYYLEQARRQSGVQIHSLKLSQPKKEGDLFDVPIELNVSGMFASHVIFDQALEQIPLFAATASFTLQGGDSLSGAAAAASATPLGPGTAPMASSGSSPGAKATPSKATSKAATAVIPSTTRSAPATPPKSVLQTVPDVQGTYTLHLYFQNADGPATPLHFDLGSGRTDPFAFAGLGDFLDELRNAFPGGGSGGAPQLG